MVFFRLALQVIESISFEFNFSNWLFTLGDGGYSIKGDNYYCEQCGTELMRK